MNTAAGFLLIMILNYDKSYLRKWVSFFIPLFLSCTTFATGFEFNAGNKKLYRAAFSLQLSVVDHSFETKSANAAYAYIGHYSDFLRAFISEEESDFIRLKSMIDNRLSIVEKVSDTNPWKNLARGEMLLQYAVMKFKWGEYLSSAYYFRRAFLLLEDNRKQFPAFIPTLKALGFFHAAIGTVPENYKWLSNLIGLRGTIEQGCKELQFAQMKVKNHPEWGFLFDELVFLNAFAQGHFKKDYVSALAALHDPIFGLNDRGSLHVFIVANTYSSMGNYNEALATMQSYRPDSNTFPLLYLHYMRGQLLLNRLEPVAEKHFNKFVSQYKGRSFIKSAWHKMAWIRLLKGDTRGYSDCINKVKSVGTDFTDEDKQALKEALSGEVPDIRLLRSRLLFDGGLYERSLLELASSGDSSFTKPRYKAEYTYRLGRIHNKLGDTSLAIQYYSSTYEKWRAEPWYYAANSALMLGTVYEEKGEREQARKWYRKTIALRNHEYQNSIDQKAEAGLSRTEKK